MRDACRTTDALAPVRYYTQVAAEVAKQVYQAQALTPPTDWVQTRAVLRVLYERATSAAWWRHTAASGEWRVLALYGVEAYGFFKIGEMVCVLHCSG